MTTGRKAGLRREAEAQQASFLELFFDLVFVLALGQLSRGLSQHLTWSGAFQTLVLLLALWWIWVHTAGLTDIFDPQRLPIQLVVTAEMLGALVLAGVAAQAFIRQGLVFAGVYVAIQLGRSVFGVLVWHSREVWWLYVRQLVWFGASAVPWIAGALTQHRTRVVLWTLAVIADSAATGLRLHLPSRRPFRRGHKCCPRPAPRRPFLALRSPDDGGRHCGDRRRLGRTQPAWTTVILGGPALFLAGRALFEYTVFARVSRNRPIGLLALAAAAPVTLHLPPLLAAAIVTGVLTAIAVADAARARRRPAEPASPPPGRRT